ncbi:MAG: PAS domain S-box protein [Ferruginibacter sp.]
MKEPNMLRAIVPDAKLTVSYKAASALDAFLKNLPDAVIITDPNFIIKAFNHAAEVFFGMPASHFIGTILGDSIDFDFRCSTTDEAMKVLFETGVWNGDIVVKRANNHDHIFKANVSLLYDEKAAVSSIVFVNHNITEEERQEKKLQIARNKYEIVVESLSEGVLLIDADAIIVASNNKAAQILGIMEEQLKGASLDNADWNAIKADGSLFPIEEFPALVSLSQGIEMNDVILGLQKPDGERVWLSINSRPIFKEGLLLPDAVVASFKDITKERNATERLKESELLFRSFMSNSPTLGWIYDEDGTLVYGNPLFIERVGLKNTSIGKHLFEISSPETAKRIFARNKEVLEKGESVITEDELILKDGTKKYFVANWFLIHSKTKRLIGGQAIDITDKVLAHQYIDKMHERFTYVVNASSDAIWDLDLRTNEIYRSDAFSKISGYAKEEIESTLEWWFDKIHPEDKERVNAKVESDLANHSTNWEDEYRFQHADGTFRYIHDKGFTIYEDGIATRQIGSMQDITERKKLESQLLTEQVQKQKLINQATINAQEEERNRISGELHDNVNQLLISSRLHIGVAKNNPQNQTELLNKATEYLLMAVEEIRALSKKMNSHIVSSVGLIESITDIAYNMQKLNEIEVATDIDKTLILKLSTEQQLMVFRIVQEQTNNIIKHAEASEASISLIEKDNNINLIISDNGKGFDKETKKMKGLGFVNIFNRIDAYNGKLDIQSSPGNGCVIDINFPITI